MPATAATLVDTIRELALLPTGRQAELRELVTSLPPNADVATELLRRGLLTSFQLRALQAGRGESLVVGRYVLIDEVGAGGMGQVFKAQDNVMDRIVALKLIRSERLTNPDIAQRFQNEIRAAARLTHPNIVRAYDAAPWRGGYYLVTEFVPGLDLATALKSRGAFAPADACSLARQVAEGLQQAHEQGLVHRDIKPANLLWSTTERVVKIADFGIARLLSDADKSDRLTREGMAIGTPDYMAPEQAGDSAHADIRSDLYSLGCTLYHFLTGEVPFPADTLIAKLLRHQTDEPVPLEDCCPGLNPELVAVVRKLMAKKPEDRYATPRAAADALAAFCPRGRAVTTMLATLASTLAEAALYPSSAAVTTAALQPGAVETLPPADQPARSRRRTWSLIALVVGGVAVLTLAIATALLCYAALTRSRDMAASKSSSSGSGATSNGSGGERPNLSDAGELQRYRAPGSVTDVVFTPDGKRFLAMVCLIDPYAHVEERFDPHNPSSTCRVYETASGEVVQSWNSPGAIRVGVLPTMDFAVECCSLNYNRGNLLYFVRATRLGELADPHLPEIVTDIPVQAARIHQFAVSPDGRYYLYAAQSWGPERKPVGDVIVATVAFSEDRKKFLTNEKNRFKGTSACFDPSNKKHLVTAFQKTVTMCDIDSGKPLNALAPADAEITCVAISKDGTRVAAGCRDGNVVVWNAQAGQRLAECHGHDGSVSAVAFAPNGTSIATGGDDSTVRIWDASSGDQIVKYAHEGPVYALTCSSVGVISGSADRTIRLWKLPE